MLMLLSVYTQINAETKGVAWTVPLHVEVSLAGSSPYKGILPFGTVLDVNYGIKRFSIHALMEGTYFLPKENITKNYNKTANLGGGIGFEIFPQDISYKSVFEVRASVTRSLGSMDYRHTAYKVGINWLAKPQKRCLTPTIGVGYCLRSFSDKNIHTYNGMYLSLGLRF